MEPRGARRAHGGGREGLLASARTLSDHLGPLFGNPVVEVHRWDAERPASVRRFVNGPGLQLIVLNIDALNKADNRIHRRHDVLGGASPSALIAACRPVVVLDEPQRMEGPRAQHGLDRLQPVVELRYSATHRDPRHLVYRLDPVQAAQQGLVKRVEVLAIEQVGGGAVEVIEVRATSRGVRAKLRIERICTTGTAPVVRAVTAGDDLERITGRAAYAGQVVEALDARSGTVRFTDGSERSVAQGDADRRRRVAAQVHAAVEEHLERELLHHGLLGPKALKVLTLMFVDTVAAYATTDGHVRRAFERAWSTLSTRPRYAVLGPWPDPSAVHAGWFAQRRGQPVDTRGASRADAEIYSLILRDKERLLDPGQPLRFLFTHSALREGWDNPNVFVVATLATAHSSMRKRQEIGRGLRLPVVADGTRCHDPRVCRLTVVTNGSYEAFCRELQREHRADWGEGDLPVRRHGAISPARPGLPWVAIAAATTWDLTLDPDWPRAAAQRLGAGTSGRGVLHVRGEVTADGRGWARQSRAVERLRASSVPDIAATTARSTGLPRHLCAQVLVESGRLADILCDPDSVTQQAERAIRWALRRASPRRWALEPRGGQWHASPLSSGATVGWREAVGAPVVGTPLGPRRIVRFAQVGPRVLLDFGST